MFVRQLCQTAQCAFADDDDDDVDDDDDYDDDNLKTLCKCEAYIPRCRCH